MKNSLKIFRKDMLIVIENNDSAVAKLSISEEIVSKDANGKIIFWNNNPGNGIYVVSGYLVHDRRSIILDVRYFVKINQLSVVEKEIANFIYVNKFVNNLSKFFTTKDKFNAQKDSLVELSITVKKASEEISELKVKKEVRDALLQMLSIRVNESLSVSTKSKVFILSPVFEKRSTLKEFV